ncbi:hypothetical protein Rs2_15676 [Raphanus sativus]|nr:hypothetical protein Rs2_15676 [Raphanus sativus]
MVSPVARRMLPVPQSGRTGWISEHHYTVTSMDTTKVPEAIYKFIQRQPKFEKSLKSAIESIRGKQSVVHQDPAGKYKTFEKQGEDLTAMVGERNLCPSARRYDIR